MGLLNWFRNLLLPDMDDMMAQITQMVTDEIEDKGLLIQVAQDYVESHSEEIAKFVDTYDVGQEILSDVTETIAYDIDTCDVAYNIDLQDLADHMDIDDKVSEGVTEHLSNIDFSDYVDTDDIKTTVSDNIIDDVISELASRLED